MHWHEWYNLFITQMKETTPLQWIAVALGVAEVLLARVNNVWLYPTGILGTILGIYLLFDVKLYADCALNVYYIVMSFYGWYYWIKKADKPPVKIAWSNSAERLITLAIAFGGTVFLYFCLTKFLFVFPHYTPSNVPFWDAWISATAWAGMWLLARRKIENWAWLNLSNIFAIPLLFYKQLPLFGCLTAFLFVIGVWGFIDWIKIYNRENPPAQPLTP
jgi:nicotinamide mononucleotide transporter